MAHKPIFCPARENNGTEKGGGNHQRDYQAGLFLGFQLLATRLAHRGGQHMACGD